MSVSLFDLLSYFAYLHSNLDPKLDAYFVLENKFSLEKDMEISDFAGTVRKIVPFFAFLNCVHC